MYGHMIEANPHALARKRPRDVHTQGFMPRGNLRQPRASLVQRCARGLEFVAQAKLLVCHVCRMSRIMDRLSAP